MDAAIDTVAANVLRSPGFLEASLAKTRQVISPFTKTVQPTAQIEELKRRDARYLDAYAKEVIDIDELRAKREGIRREIEVLSRMQVTMKTLEDSDLNQLARLIVKAAMRYSKITDIERKQKIIREIFQELHVRDRTIVSFRFKDSLVRGSLGEGMSGNATILLQEPVWITAPPDIIPEGTKRCITCGDIKPMD